MELPQEVKVCLWSYDTDRIDLALPDHRTRLIENVLNYGTASAISWLQRHISREEIAETIRKSSVSVWNKKSLALWSLVYGTHPARASRFA